MCAKSPKLAELFSQAEDLADQYAEVKNLRKRAKAFFPLSLVHNLASNVEAREKVFVQFLTSHAKMDIPFEHTVLVSPESVQY